MRGFRLRRAWPLRLALSAAVLCAGAAWAGAAQAQPVVGLIVKARSAAAAPADDVAAPDQAAFERAHVERTRTVAQTLARRGWSGLRAVGGVGRDMQRLDFDRPRSRAAARAEAERLRASGEFEWVMLNQWERPQQAAPTPSDPLFAAGGQGLDQWWLRERPTAPGYRGVPNLPAAWARITGSPAAPVAVLDTGVTAHPDLGNSVTGGGYDLVSQDVFSADGQPGRDGDPSDPGDFVSNAEAIRPAFSDIGCLPEDSSWHGTVITGIIGATSNNGTGVASINWGARVLPVRVAAKCGALVSDLIDGMRWAAGRPVAGLPRNAERARVVNVSFGSVNACEPAYQEAVDELARWGTTVVAAAGNGVGGLSSDPTVIRPANCNGVVAVAALNADGFKASYASFGPAVTIGTVGGDPDGVLGDGGLVTVNNESPTTPGATGYAAHAGSSFAAPMVAGTLSLMLALNPSLSTAQLIEGLRSSARPHVQRAGLPACDAVSAPGRCNCSTATCGAGILDADRALQYAVATTGTYQEPPSDGGGGGGGGGAVGLAWLGLLVAALGVARWTRKAGPGQAAPRR